MSELTAEQRQQRCDWAREMRDTPAVSVVWSTVEDCVGSLVGQGLYGISEFAEMFQAPEKHPSVLDALFEEWANRKLLGEIT